MTYCVEERAQHWLLRGSILACESCRLKQEMLRLMGVRRVSFISSVTVLLWAVPWLGFRKTVDGFAFFPPIAPLGAHLRYTSSGRNVLEATRETRVLSTASSTDETVDAGIASESHTNPTRGYHKAQSELMLQDTKHDTPENNKNQENSAEADMYKLQGKLLKNLRQVCKDYDMIQDGDHIMVCVSGGKDSACLLYLLLLLQEQLQQQQLAKFRITAVHVDQHQPGYNGTSLVNWLKEDLNVPYHVVSEDTYSIVVNKTAPNKSYCTVCSRLRRGIIYTTAKKLGCNKIALGHHADDAMETLLLNMIYAGQIKGMPARYTSSRHSLGVLRPLMACFEDDLQTFATMKQFPILPCNLCSNQANLQRPQMKLFLSMLQTTCNTNVKQNILHAMKDVRPSHLLDQNLRKMCGMDPVTGETAREDYAEEKLLGTSFDPPFVNGVNGRHYVEDDDDDPI